jgi:beta-lactamase class A
MLDQNPAALVQTLVALLAFPLVAHAAASAPSALEAEISARAKAFRGVFGLAAKNLATGEVVLVNPDQRFPSASTIKTPILVEAFRQIDAGRLKRDQLVTLRAEDKVGGSGVLRILHPGLQITLNDALELMISQSDNTATNLVVGLVGTANVNSAMESYGLKDTLLFRPTFRQGRPDVHPQLEKEFGLGMSTPRDMCRLFELIAEGRAVSPKASADMATILKHQRYQDMIPRGLPDAAEVANKTGTDEEKLPGPDGIARQVRADGGIVKGPKARYVIAIFTRQVEDGRGSVDNDALVFGGTVSRLVYDHFNQP